MIRDPNFKYVRLTSWYKYGGFAYEEFEKEDVEKYFEELNLLFGEFEEKEEEIKKEKERDKKGSKDKADIRKNPIDKVELSFTRFFGGVVIYPIEDSDVRFTDTKLSQLSKLF